MTRLRNNTVLLICDNDVGQCLATQCAQQGAKILLWDSDGLQSQRLAAQLRQLYGVTAVAYQVDITSANQVVEASAAVARDFREVNVLIYGVDLLHNKLFTQLSSNELEQTMARNLLGMMRVVKAFLPLMEQTKTGHLVTISSCIGMLHAPRLVDYGASKAALTAFHKALRDDLHRDRRLRGVVHMTLLRTTFSTNLVDAGKSKATPRLPVLMKPDEFARRTVKAIKKDEREVVFPSQLPWIQAVLALFAAKPTEWFRAKFKLSSVTECLHNTNGMARR